MKKATRLALTFAFAFATLAAGTLTSRAALMKWLDVSDEERAATASTIQPDAGAEVLYRLKQVDDSKVDSATTTEYWRIKAYNKNGVEALSKIEILYDPKTETIKDLAARVIKPDGSSTNLGKKDFFDREAAKAGKQRLRLISFSFPGLEPGVIVEYQFRRLNNDNLFGLRLDFMGDMPARRVVLRYKTVPLAPPWSTLSFYHLTNGKNRKSAKDGFYYFEMTNVKSYVEEPYMPPEDEVRPWMLFYPARYGVSTMFWDSVAAGLSADYNACVKKGTKLVSATAEEITRGITEPLAQAAAINDYCRARILNISFFPPDGPPDPKLFTKDARSPDDVIKTKKGRSSEILFLFVALARALDIDASPALCSRRSDGVFSTKLLLQETLHDPVVAVRDGDDWHFFDPVDCETDTGLLPWDNEGQPALIAQDNKGLWETTPRTPAEKSRAKRTADLQLTEDGALSGTVRIEMTGQVASRPRYRYLFKTQTAIDKEAGDPVKARMPSAEISDVTASGMDDVLKPFVLTYKVSVPNYAEQTGRRMFVQPGFFTKGDDPWFTAATRVYDICFNYAMIQEDEVSIKAPDGYSIEEGSAPEGIRRSAWGQYTVSLGFRPKSRVIVYKRAFEYSILRAPASGYDTIKKLFDFIHTQDTHTLTLKKDN